MPQLLAARAIMLSTAGIERKYPHLVEQAYRWSLKKSENRPLAEEERQQLMRRLQVRQPPTSTTAAGPMYGPCLQAWHVYRTEMEGHQATQAAGVSRSPSARRQGNEPVGTCGTARPDPGRGRSLTASGSQATPEPPPSF